MGECYAGVYFIFMEFGTEYGVISRPHEVNRGALSCRVWY